MRLGRRVVEGMLRMRGRHHQADRAREELPDVVDTDHEHDRDGLTRLGVRPHDLARLDDP